MRLTSHMGRQVFNLAHMNGSHGFVRQPLRHTHVIRVEVRDNYFLYRLLIAKNG